MAPLLRVHPSFFTEFASKTWTSPYAVVSELVENSFDEDATIVLVTVLENGSVMVEDDVGMDKAGIAAFLMVGSPRKQENQYSSRFNRVRSGRYGTGRLGFLTAFKRILIKTRRKNLAREMTIDERALEKLAKGDVRLKTAKRVSLKRDGTEVQLLNPKVGVDFTRLGREMRRLACLKQPFFELYLRRSKHREEWRLEGATRIEPPEVEGLRVDISEPGLEGEIMLSKHTLPEEERGLMILVGGHATTRTSFGVSSTYGDRITGWVRGKGLTARFADKSALIEDEAFNKFSSRVKDFIKQKILPVIRGYAETEITVEEVRVYRQVDQLLANAVQHVLKPDEVDANSIGKGTDHTSTPRLSVGSDGMNVKSAGQIQGSEANSHKGGSHLEGQTDSLAPKTASTDEGHFDTKIPDTNPQTGQVVGKQLRTPISPGHGTQASSTYSPPQDLEVSKVEGDEQIGQELPPRTSTGEQQTNHYEKPNNQLSAPPPPGNIEFSTQTTSRRRSGKRFYSLRRVGYKVIPYEDDHDEKEAFAEGSDIFVNKAHPAYQGEAWKGGELLLRHVARLVTKIIALGEYPEGREALDLQNRLIAEVIRLRQKK